MHCFRFVRFKQVPRQAAFIAPIWIKRAMNGYLLWCVADRVEVLPFAGSHLLEEIPELRYPGTFSEVGTNTYREVETGEYG